MKSVTFEWTPAGTEVTLEITARLDEGDVSVGLYPWWFIEDVTVPRAFGSGAILSFKPDPRDVFRTLYGGNELEHVEQYAGDLAAGIAEDRRAEQLEARAEDPYEG